MPQKIVCNEGKNKINNFQMTSDYRSTPKVVRKYELNKDLNFNNN